MPSEGAGTVKDGSQYQLKESREEGFLSWHSMAQWNEPWSQTLDRYVSVSASPLIPRKVAHHLWVSVSSTVKWV